MEQAKKRNGFASGFGFILAAAGSAIGLGNLWSFPYKTSANGGAAFVMVYMLSVLVIGLIVMIAEIHLGKRAQANPITAYKKANKNFGWLGVFAIIIPFFITCYYSVLGGYTIKYTVSSFSGNANIATAFAGNIWQVILFTLIFLFLAVLVVMGGVKNGIEKASKVLMPALFLILVAIAIYSLCLGEGVSDGLNFYLNPDFTELGFKGVLAAMSQAFFSLSLGMGIMVSYGSYAGKEMKMGRSVGMIVLFDTLVALIAGLAIFPAIYHYKAVNPNAELASGGILLMFDTMPLIFESMGLFGKFVSFFFFAMIVIAALTSVISLMEVVTQFMIQKFRVSRKKSIVIIALIVCILSVPIGISLGKELNGNTSMMICGYNWVDFLDNVTNVVLMPIGALGACITLGWFTFKGNKKSDIFNPLALNKQLEDDGLKLGFMGKVFSVMIKYVTPLLILVVEIFGVIEFIAPIGLNGTREFSVNGLGLVLTAYALCGLAIALYFIFWKKRPTGYNADELEIDNSLFRKKKVNSSEDVKTEKENVAVEVGEVKIEKSETYVENEKVDK